jgi:pimeloyl-ACP methyl ester carboxylesterase
MGSIVTDRGVVHYETIGRGPAALLLHCWLGSWANWRDAMTVLARSYRVHALDFWGFGESSEQHHYEIADYVSMVETFMDTLGIASAPVLGHSMGGSVALCLALKQPERVQKVVIVGSPVDGASLSFWLHVAGKPFFGWLAWNVPFFLPVVMRLYAPWIATDHRRWYRMFKEDINRTSMQAFCYSIGSLAQMDLRPRLQDFKMPVLGIFGAKDNIVNPNQAALVNRMPFGRSIIFERSRHYPMLDESERFFQTLLAFLQEPAAGAPAVLPAPA